MDVAAAVEIRRITSQLPKIPPIKPTPLNRSLLRGLEVNAWHMWKLPLDGLFYPGQIKAIDDVERTFKYMIPSELIYKANSIVSDQVFVETFRFYVNTQSLGSRGLYPSQIGIIRWPDVLDNTTLESQMQAFTHGAAEGDLLKVLNPQKQAVFFMLKANLTMARNIYLQETTVLKVLHDDWSAFCSSWPSNKRSQMAFEFAALHLSLLDDHDKFIIQHIAMWVFAPRDETSRNMDMILGLGRSIFSYLCLAHYLGITPDDAYLHHKNKRIIRPRVLHEDAWKTIEACVMYENQQDWTSFRSNHRVLDKTLELPKLRILRETNEENSDSTARCSSLNPKLLSMSPGPSSTSKPTTAQSSRSSSIKPSTAQSSRSSSVNPDPINLVGHNTSGSRTKYPGRPIPNDGRDDSQDNVDLVDDLNIPVAQRRAKRKAVLNHAFIKSGP